MSIPTAQTINGIMIGVVLAGIANGVLAVQMCRYFRKPGNDLLFKKLFVLFIWLATAIHLFLAMAAFHTEAITEYEESILVMIYPEAGLAVAGVGGAIQSSVQSIYIYRLYKLTGHRAFPAVCLALSTYIVGTGIAYTSDVKSELLMDAVLRNPTGWSWLICSYLSVVVATDILIAASTCWYLIQRRDSGLKSTRRLVNRIMLRIVQTGVATSVVALCVLILFTTCNTSIWLSLYMLLAPLYPITLLALLNGRVRWVEEPSTIRTVGLSLESSVRICTDNNTNTNLSQARGQISTLPLGG